MKASFPSHSFRDLSQLQTGHFYRLHRVSFFPYCYTTLGLRRAYVLSALIHIPFFL